ncbi:MAG: class I SAM-dependent methyltransferase [Promethearchaeota archaeon]
MNSQEKGTKKPKKTQSNIDFRFMSFFFKIRDIFKSPMIKIEKANIKQGNKVLDYGCGPGSFAIAAAEVVGSSGKVYAADINPLAIKKIKKATLKKGLSNIETILTDCNTGLGDNSIDVILCFDTIHNVDDKESLLKEFHRVLQPDSILALDDHHMEEDEIISKITEGGLFELSNKKENLYLFIKRK